MADDHTLVPRVQAHLDQLRAAGSDTAAFFDALLTIRDDNQLTAPQRDALCRAVALESAYWYFEALTGEPVDREALMEAAKKATAAHATTLQDQENE